MLAGMGSLLGSVFREHWPAYRRKRRLPLRAHKAAVALSRCRTATLGGHVARCPQGHVDRVWYNSCRHRACPQCAWAERERWVQRQIARLPACDYFHVVFTVSEELNPLWLYNRRAFTNLLLRAAWETLRQMLADPKHLGALPGALGGFHSWGQTLWVHPHAHFLVTAGGIDPQGRWRPCPFSGLLPARALSAKFRGKLRAWLRREIQCDRLVLPPGRTAAEWLSTLDRLGRKKHHVMIMPRYSHGRGVVRYLGRYLKGGCVSDRRLTRLEHGRVQLAYRDNQTHPPKSRSLEFSGEEFLDRVLAHVPESGQHMVRSYGLFNPVNRDTLELLRQRLGEVPRNETEELLAELTVPNPHPRCCPVCGLLLVVFPIPRTPCPPPRGPPP